MGRQGGDKCSVIVMGANNSGGGGGEGQVGWCLQGRFLLVPSGKSDFYGRALSKVCKQGKWVGRAGCIAPWGQVQCDCCVGPQQRRRRKRKERKERRGTSCTSLLNRRRLFSRGFVLLKCCLGNTPNLQISYCPYPIQVLMVSC